MDFKKKWKKNMKTSGNAENAHLETISSGKSAKMRYFVDEILFFHLGRVMA